ncbi:MAG: TM2 domain-containing protein [Deltaproteobacteria bacterium]|nr:TM2 domain-containing protein [Deltaproteobacteria bacterium]
MHDKTLAWIFWALGGVGLGGLHRFYLGRPWSGLLYLCTWNLGGIGMVIDAISMDRLVEDANDQWRFRRQLRGEGHAPLELPAPAPHPGSLMHELLRAAATRNGAITLSEAVMDTGADYAAVDEELTALMRRGVAVVENHAETGVVIYRFPELEKRG